jgi:hypothetical protein
MKEADQLTYARFVVAASTIVRNQSFHLLIDGLVEALEDQRDNNYRRKHDQIQREAINARITQLRGIK